MNEQKIAEQISELNLQYLTLCKCREDYSPAMVEPELTQAILALIEQEQKPMVEALKRLSDATGEAIDEAIECNKKGQNPFMHDAVNWGDLNCVSAEYYTNNHGDTGYRVFIEEAAPDCSGFQQFIYNALKSKGFNAEVMTEW